MRAVLAAALGIGPPYRSWIAVPGLRLEIAEWDPGRVGRAADRLEAVAPDLAADDAGPGAAGPAEDSPVAGASFLALGWATVDLDRAAAASSGMRWTAVPRDPFLGARALLGEPVPAGAATAGAAGAAGAAHASRGPATTLLLEPDTEGRLAAVLARLGEGPAAIYLGASRDMLVRARARLTRLGVRVATTRGPLGSGMAIAGPPAWSPVLVMLAAAETTSLGVAGPVPAEGPAPRGRGTIRP